MFSSHYERTLLNKGVIATLLPGDFISPDGKFTGTVNINDEGVVINMTPDTFNPAKTAEWRKNGNVILSNSESSVYTFESPISPEDEGIYEIYYTGERETGRIGLYRLIVRGNK